MTATDSPILEGRTPVSGSLHPLVGPLRVVMFQPRFARLVEAGEKWQTIRPKRKIPVRAGDRLSLREWTGLPYRSKQRQLRDETVCERVELFTLDVMRVRADRDDFARADGFEDWPEMLNWFLCTHGYAFKGVTIYWPNVLMSRRQNND